MRLHRLIHHAAVRVGFVIVAAIVLVALSSTSGRHTVVAVLAATIAGIPSAKGAAAAETDGAANRPFKFHASDEDLADLRRRYRSSLLTDGPVQSSNS